MKIVTVSIVILLSLLVLLYSSALWAKNKADELSSLLEMIRSDDACAGIEEFCSAWESCKSFFKLTVHRDKLQRVSYGIELLKASAMSGDEGLFYLGIKTLRSAIDEISAFSSFSLANIL